MAADRTVSVTLQAKVAGFAAGMSAAAKSATGLDGKLSALARTNAATMESLSHTAGAAGLAVSLGIGAIVKAGADFDREMSAVAAVADTSAASLDRLRAAAIDAGKTTQYTATQAAQAEEELSKAGISVQDILGGGLAGALSLAAAGQMDLADAATIAAQAMNVFSLRGSAVPHVADVLASAANKSAADMQGLGMALRQGGLVANQFGLTLEDTVGTLSAFADRALIGSDAGTSLKTMLQALANPSAKSAKLMQKLGISAYDASGQFVGIVGLAQQLKTQLGGLTQAQRDQALAQIFGSDAMRAANVLYSQGAAGMRRYIAAVDDSGAASETARRKTDNLMGDIERLRGAVESLAISSSSGASQGLRKLAQGATAAVNAFSGLPAPIQEATVIVGGLTGAVTLLGAGFVKAKTKAAGFMSDLRGLGPTGTKAADALGKIAGGLGKAGLVGGAIVAVYEGFKLIQGWVDGNSHRVTVDIDALTASLRRFGETGHVTGEMTKLFGSDLRKLSGDITLISTAEQKLDELNKRENAAIAVSRGIGGGNLRAQMNQLKKDVDDAKKSMKELDDAAAQLVQNGGATQALLALHKMADKSGVSFQDLIDELPKYRDAVNQANAANSGLAKGFGDITANARTMNTSLRDAIAHGQTLTDVFKQLNGAANQLERANITAEQAIDDLSQSLKDNGKSLDIDTRKGRSNMSAILDVLDAAKKAAQAKYDETGSVEAASKTYDDYVDSLKATLKNAGLTDDQIKKLIDTYGKIPPVVTTSVKTPGLDESYVKVQDLKEKFTDINGKTITTTVRLITHGDVNTIAGSLVKFRREGGIRMAADGLVSLGQASIYPAIGRPTYGFAEPGTGGEAFVPRYGDYLRSVSILDRAARWYGGRFAPAATATATTPAQITINAVQMDETRLAAAVTRRLEMAGV